MSEDQRTPPTVIRHLVRTCSQAALATIMRDEQGAPYASLVLVACDHDASPILMLSDLADHTRNIRHDPRVSLLFDGTAGRSDPLTGERATLQGRLTQSRDPVRRRRYLAGHPSADAYADFGDFNIYTMTVERAHLVAGFGRIHWVQGSDVVLDPADTRQLVDAEQDIVDHMNSDHADAVQLFASNLLGQPDRGWRVTGIDAEGIDLRCNAHSARLWFDERVSDPKGARFELVRLTRLARSRSATSEQL